MFYVIFTFFSLAKFFTTLESAGQTIELI